MRHTIRAPQPSAIDRFAFAVVSPPTTNSPHRWPFNRDKPAFYELVDFINKNLPREEANRLKLAFVKVSPFLPLLGGNW